MRVIALQQHGGVEQLKLDHWPKPSLGDNQALVEVKACGLNYMDVFVMHGMPDVHTEMPRIPGGDVAGIVREVSADVSTDWIGKRVVLFPRLPKVRRFSERSRSNAAYRPSCLSPETQNRSSSHCRTK